MKVLRELGFKESSDEGDRLYGIDYIKEINGKFIGVQIKPPTFGSTTSYKDKSHLRNQHRKFESEYGKVFIIIKNEDIKNPEVIDEIKQEIKRLSS